jgi:hypothetical protein
MANHKRRSSISPKGRSRQLEHKSARAATAQALAGGHHRRPRSGRYYAQLPQPPLLDEHQVVGSSARGSRTRWCRGRVGVEHVLEYRAGSRPYHGWGWYCTRCHKRLWGRHPASQSRVEDVAAEHWSLSNITTRLAGGACACSTCKIKNEAKT